MVQGKMQPVVHRPRGKPDATLSRCLVAFRMVLGGASVETAGVRRLEFVSGPMDIAGSTQVAYNVRRGHGLDLSIGVMIAGNSGRPGGAIYKPWFASPEQRLQAVHPGHRTQEESIMAAWLVGSERIAPHQLRSECDQLRRWAYENMEKRFLRCLHSQWGMVENHVNAFEGFIDRAGEPINVPPPRWPHDVRQRWLATMQGVD